MSLAEVLPEVRALSRIDKVRLIQILARDLEQLEQDESDLIQPGRTYPVFSPDRAFIAAAALLQALEEEKAQP